MSSSKTFNARLFIAIAAVTLVAAAFAIARLDQQVRSNGGVVLLSAHVRYLIQPRNTELGRAYIRQELEADQLTGVGDDIHQVCGIYLKDDACAELTGAVWAVTNQNTKLTALQRLSLTSVEARRAVANLGGSKYTKAQELYVLGLVRSSQRVVVALPDTSVPIINLKARLALAGVGSGGVTQAERYLNQSLKLDPASADTLRLALAVSRKTSNNDGQQQFEAQLKAVTR